MNFHQSTVMIFDSLGASGFLFISGVSIALSYRNKLNKVNSTQEYSYRTVRNHYLMRAVFILMALGLRKVYKLWQGRASLIVLIGNLSFRVIVKLEERSNKKVVKEVFNSRK